MEPTAKVVPPVFLTLQHSCWQNDDTKYNNHWDTITPLIMHQTTPMSHPMCGEGGV